jgi:glycerol kinase
MRGLGSPHWYSEAARRHLRRPNRTEFLMQFQADALRVPIEAAAENDTTALGGAVLTRLAVGTWRRNRT